MGCAHIYTNANIQRHDAAVSKLLYPKTLYSVLLGTMHTTL